MILFYEGLPRSGKSLNAIKEYVVPMLKKGRTVYAYIEGLNHQKIAELSDITLEKCEDLLMQLKREEVLKWPQIVTNDAFLVIDEAQNFYPNSRKVSTPELISAVAEHGHRGLDILLMGQVFSDVDKLWTGRCAQRVLFQKREAAGKPDEFSQIIYKPIIVGDRTKWQELKRIKGIPYDKNFFGAYASHQSDTDNKDTLIDDRANVWNTTLVRRTLPIFAFIALLSLAYLIYMFMGGGLQRSLTPNKPLQNKGLTLQQLKLQSEAQSINSIPSKPPYTQLQPITKQTPLTQEQQPIQVQNELAATDEIDELDKLGRSRLSGFIKSKTKMIGLIEWRSNDFKVLQRLTFQQIKAMGYLVLLDADNSVAILTNGLKRHVVTSWPVIDSDGQVTQSRINLIASQP